MNVIPRKAPKFSSLATLTFLTLLALGTGCGFSTGAGKKTETAPPLAISTTSLPSAAVGTAYSQTVVATGGNTPYTWATVVGSLPAGLNIDSNSGIVSGVPTTAQASTFSIEVIDSSAPAQTAEQSFTINVASAGSLPTITTSSLPNGTTGTSYSSTLTATGGVAPYSWSISSGVLPGGLNLSSGGTLSGTPTTAQSSTFTILVADSSSPKLTGAKSFTVNIAQGVAPLSITTSSLAGGVTGTAYSAAVAATGGLTPYSWSITSGSLPAGLSLNGSTGAISGNPTTAGTSTFTVQAADSSSPKLTATKSLSITITASVPPVSITTTSVPSGITGTAYSSTLAATGGKTPYTWTVASGSLPAGLSLSSGGTISGTPTTAATSTFTVQVADSSSPKLTDTQSLSITITASVAPINITTTSLPAGTTGTAYSSTLAATGGKTPYAWTVVSGSLPAGLSLSSAGVISGTPTTAATSTFSVQVADSSSPKLTDTQALSITVTASVAPINITTTTVPGGTTGTAYSTTLVATGGKTPYAWTVTSGSLPAGLSLSSGGVISGTPTTAATSTFTVQVADSSSPKLTDSQSLSITVTASVAPLVIGTSSLPNGTTGTAYSQTISVSGGKTPYSWSISSGTLPTGLSLSGGGTISGTPTGSGASTFTVQVQDSSSPKLTATKSYTVTINPAALTITTTSLSNGTTSVAYSATLARTGGTAPFTWSISSGTLPAGLSLAATTGTISGTPSGTGKSTFTAKVVDSSSPQQNATASLSITIGTSIYDQYGGLTTMPSPNSATTYFRTEKFSNNKWMFVDPANNGFFMIGMYVLDVDRSVDDMGDSYYNRVNAKYGDTGPTWADAQLQRLQSWGFNSIGTYASDYTLPTATDSRWGGNDTNPIKVPFVGLLRPAYYGMLNQSNWSPQPIKNMLYGLSSYYDGYDPGNGVADYYDANLTTFFTNELQNDVYSVAVKASAYKNYMIGMNIDDGDEMYGFGKGPDFTGGYNNSHLGWMVLTMSPLQTSNPSKGFIYPDNVVHSKTALQTQLTTEYGTISALNAAWGSNYTTFGSSGTTITAESVGSGNGSTLSFNKTLAGATVSKYSLAILVGGTMVGGDTGNGSLWGPTMSGTVNYTTGALTVNFSSGHAPASGAAVTANYVQNGWGIGTGLMDEDARPSHRSWVGIDYTFMTDVDPTTKTDLDNYLYQIAAHYFSMCRSGIQSWLPGMMYFGPDTLGTWGAPSNRNVLKAASQYIDVVAMGGGTPMTQAMIDFMYTWNGDKPFYFGEFRTANPDSAFYRYSASVPQTDFTTQGGRGVDYTNEVTTYPTLSFSANGSRPYIGVVWWQYLDNWGEKDDWGIVSLSDNAYDGSEAVKGTGGVGVRSIPCQPPISQYMCGGEERNYGDVITPITNAHAQIMQAVQH